MRKGLSGESARVLDFNPNFPHSPFHSRSVSLSEFSSSASSMIHDLIENKSNWICRIPDDPSLSIVAMPQICNINVERIKGQILDRTGKTIGLNPIFYYSIYHGLSYFLSHVEVQRCCSIRKQFTISSERIDPRLNKLMDGFISKFEIGVFPGRRKNFPVSYSTSSLLSTFSHDIGLSKSDLSVLSIMKCLSDEEDCVSGHREEMKKIIDDFLFTIEWRNRGITVLMNEFNI